jgi:hypothetical protein
MYRLNRPAALFPVGLPLRACLPALAALAGFIFWCLSAHTQFRFADEGLLWYGGQRVLAGDIPLRDFWAYDPLRYYWVAGVMALMHSYGMVAVNIAGALAGAIGIGLAIRLVFRGVQNPAWELCLLFITTLLLWMVPRVHLFDIAASVILLATLSWMLETPDYFRCFITGLTLGVVAIVRRDHGLYGGLAEAAALSYVGVFDRRPGYLKACAAWAAGIFVGYSPLLLAVLLVPGFWEKFWASIHWYFDVGATNLPVPVPWPWRLHFAGQSWPDVIRYLIRSTSLLSLPLFGLGLVIYSVRRALSGRRPESLLFAAGLLTVPYAHHAFARAEIYHLSASAFPALVGLCVLIVKLPRLKAAAFAALACLLSSILLAPTQPLYLAWQDGWVKAQIGPDEFRVPQEMAQEVAVVAKLTDRYAAAGQELVAVPALIGVYTITGRRAAVWDTYSAVPASAQIQQADIDRMQSEHPALVIIGGVEGKWPAGGYAQSHALVYDFIRDHYTLIHPDFVPPEMHWQVYVPPDAR